MDDNSEIRCCRICLDFDCKLMPMSQYRLDSAYTHMLELPLFYKDELSQDLCVQCAMLLFKYDRFKNKSHMALQILSNVKMYDSKKSNSEVKEIIKINRNEMNNKYFPKLKYSDYIIHLNIEPDAKRNNLQTNEITKFDDDDENNITDDDLKIKDNKTTEELADSSPGNDNDQTDFIGELKESKADEFIDNYNEISDSNFTDEHNDKLTDTKESINEPETLVCNVKKTDKLKKKLSKLLEQDGSDFDDDACIEEMKRKYKTIGDATIRNIKIRKKRYALVNEYFIKKTLLSLNEQRESFEKLKLIDNYVNAKFKCDLCYKGLVTKKYLDNHFNKCHNKALGPNLCQVCKMRFKREKLLLQHMKRAHVYEYQCNSCDASFTNILAAESHANFHKGIKYVCQHCGIQYEKHTVYLTHLRIKHPTDHVCVYCGYSFIGEHGLNAHIKRKHKERSEFANIPCNNCELRFVSEKALITHTGIRHPNEGEKPFYNDSQMSTSKRTGREKLQPRSSKKREKEKMCRVKFPVPCESCGVELSCGMEYKSHFAKAHPNLKRTFLVSRYYPLMCDKCGRGFQAISVLNDHLLTHGSESNVKCPKCDARFKSTSQMKIHLTSHDGPAECHICGASISKKNMKRHIQITHTEEKNFPCSLCGKHFKTNFEVKIHTKHVHMNVPWPKKRSHTDSAPLRKRRKIQRHTRESETEDSHHAAFDVPDCLNL